VDVFAYISDLGWTAPSGKRFKEWNIYRDGTGGACTPGEDTGESHESVYTVYAIWEDIIPYLVTDEELVSVADAIREKGGTSALLSWPTQYVEAIGDIQTGGSSTIHSITNNAAAVGVTVDKTIAYPFESVTITTSGLLKLSWVVKVGTSSGSDDVAYFDSNFTGWNGCIMRFPMPDSDIYITASLK